MIPAQSHCNSCGARLTVNEITYYGRTCTRCERADDYRESPAMTPAPADAQPVAWIDKDGLRDLHEHGECIVYQVKQEFVLLPATEQTPLYAHPPAAPAQDVGEAETDWAALCAVLDELTRLRAALAVMTATRDLLSKENGQIFAKFDAANARAEAMAAERDSLVRAFEAERTALCNSLNSALADTSRLTWLDRDDISLSLGTDPNGPYVVILNAKGIAIAATSDIRSAIDDARSKL